MSLLLFIMGLPLLTAVVLTLVSRKQRAVFRGAAMSATLASMVLAIYVFTQFQTELGAIPASEDSPPQPAPGENVTNPKLNLPPPGQRCPGRCVLAWRRWGPGPSDDRRHGDRQRRRVHRRP